VIFATLLMRRTPWSTLAAAGVGTIAGALPALIYHELAFGAPWLTGYAFKAHGDFQAIHERGFLGITMPTLTALWGILFSANRGLFFYSPLLLLAPLGLRRMVKKDGWRDAGPMLTASITYILFASAFVDWQAGWCAAARHLTPMVPLLTIAALHGLVALAASSRGALMTAILMAASGIHAALTIVLTPFFPPQFGLPFAELVLPSLADGAGFWNVVSSVSGAPPIAVVIACVLVAVGAMVWAAGKIARHPNRWLTTAPVLTVTALLLLNTWLGSHPTREVELMRSQVLRRLGHVDAAERIEASLPAASAAENE
jgi:hypothetical protein